MNRVTIFLAVFSVLLLVSCQETREDLKKSAKDTYQTIGEEIPFETGMQWIAFYQERNSKQNRSALIDGYNIPSAQLASLLESTASLVGVAFHYGLDNAGTTHIIVIPVDGSLDLWSSIPGRIYVDANTGEAISQSLAETWASNFKQENPDEIWFHFFGKNIFDEMRALPYFQSVYIEPAVNILNLTPQLLLVVYNDDLISLGRANSVPGTVYDASNACPPCAAR